MIDCQPDRQSIAEALNKLYSPAFQADLKQVCSPYGEGGASEEIVGVLRSFDMVGARKKAFHDLHMHPAQAK